MKPTDPFPSPREIDTFHSGMRSRWDEIATLLAADRPPDWQCYRFAADFQAKAQLDYEIVCEFHDQLSNRQRIVPRPVIDRLADLHLAYLNFSAITEFAGFSIEQIWDPAAKRWNYNKKWRYCIS